MASPRGRNLATCSTIEHLTINENDSDGDATDATLSQNNNDDISIQNIIPPVTHPEFSPHANEFTPPAGNPPGTHAPTPRPLMTTTSALSRAARESGNHALPTTLADDLAWQARLPGDAASIKAFRNEALQQMELCVFAYMRPHSPFVHLMHSAATFFATGGDSFYKGKDIGFARDKTITQTPTPVILKQDQWKWVTKRVVLDVVRLDGFYSNPTNCHKLWCPVN